RPRARGGGRGGGTRGRRTHGRRTPRAGARGGEGGGPLMVAIGYMLASEEHSAPDLVRNAQRAEEAGFSFALVSDHYHPWVEAQGQSPFVWGVLGAIAQATERLEVGTGVTCPTIRIHPA